MWTGRIQREKTSVPDLFDGQPVEPAIVNGLPNLTRGMTASKQFRPSKLVEALLNEPALAGSRCYVLEQAKLTTWSKDATNIPQDAGDICNRAEHLIANNIIDRLIASRYKSARLEASYDSRERQL